MSERIKLDLRTFEEEVMTAEDPTAVFQKYFESTEGASPFQADVKLKESVEVEGGEAGFIDWMDLVNKLMTRKRKRKYKSLRKDHPEFTVVVSEGDSWFQHPLIKDTIEHLYHSHAILSLGAAGDEIIDMVKKGQYLDAIREEQPEVFLVSGGGNDVLGEPLASMLEPWFEDDGRGPARIVNQNLPAKLEEIVQAYHTLVDQVRAINPDLKIVIHSYDYVIPRDGGKYLGKKMADKQIHEKTEQQDIMKYIIDTYFDTLKSKVANLEGVVLSDHRGIVASNKWFDEIHPSRDGFKEVAKKFRTYM